MDCVVSFLTCIMRSAPMVGSWEMCHFSSRINCLTGAILNTPARLFGMLVGIKQIVQWFTGIFTNLLLILQQAKSLLPPDFAAWSMVVSLGRPTIYYEYKPDNIVLDAYNKAGLIRSLCVFMSPEKSGYDIFNADIEDWTLSIGPTIFYTAPFDSEAFKGLPDVANHFLVNEIPIDDLLESISIGGVKRIPVILDRNQLASIETNENLPIDNFSSHKLIPNAHYLYNSRLHLGDVSILPGPMQSPFIDWFYDASEEEYITPAERDNFLFNDYFGEGFTIVEDNTGILAGLNFFLHVEIISDGKTYQKNKPYFIK